MAYNPPTYGESGEVYTDNVRNSLEHVRTTAEAAQAAADGNNASVVAASQSADEAKEVAEAAKAFVEAPTDSRVATLVQDSTSSTGAALNAAYAGKDALPGRAEFPLDIPTYDGNPQVAHPDVLFIPEGFGPEGHRYWMAFTPYPSDPRENPSVASSPDGVKWTIPPGAPNPVVPHSEIEAAGFIFNSDNDLVRLPDDRLAIYYRPINNNTGSFRVAIMRKTTMDGVTWSAAETIADEPYTSTDIGYRSPALVVEDDGTTVTMWNVADIGGTRTLTRRQSTDSGATFGAATACTIPTLSTDLWHVDVVRAEGQYWTLVNRRGKWDLQLLVSDDGLTFAHVRLIPKTGRSVDGYGHYRSTLVPVPGPSGLAFDLWVSAVDDTGVGPESPPHDSAWRLIVYRGVPARQDGTDDFQSLALGNGAAVNGTVRGTAVGVEALVTGEIGTGSGAAVGYAAAAAREAVAIGGNSVADPFAVAIGAGTTADDYNVAIGSGITASSPQAVVIGRAASVTGSSGTAVGNAAKAAITGTALGHAADATATDGVAIGDTVKAGSTGVSIGSDITSVGAGTVAIGRLAAAAGPNSVALGRTTSAGHSESVALGNGSTTTAANQVMVGPRDVEVSDATRGIILKSPDGTRYRVTVANGGTLTVTAV